MLTTEEAELRLQEVLAEKSIAKRMKLASDVLDIANQIPDDPQLSWMEFLERCLKDGLETKSYEQGLRILAFGFSGDDQKRLLEPAVEILVRAGEMKTALEWVEIVGDVFGPNALAPLLNNQSLDKLHANKMFQKLTGPKAKIQMLTNDLKEAMKEWKSGDVDDLRDAIELAESLVKDIPKSEKALLEKAKKHRDAVIKKTREMIKEEPDLKDYLKGLI